VCEGWSLEIGTAFAARSWLQERTDDLVYVGCAVALPYRQDECRVPNGSTMPWSCERIENNC
jgi:hypothetical protein